ncbi:MAG TPA: hypothetical protein EYN31_01225 [Candidatus Marinimicrobia bacterium]|nr:hypothetical protein [Candidatus Neomarinimicrobiota bacterium]
MKSERNLAALTDQGQSILQQYLDDLAIDHTLEPPFGILDNHLYYYNLAISKLSATPSPRIVELRDFDNKYEFANYITPLIQDLKGIEKNSGFWSWLTLFYFEQICPAKDGQRRKLRNAFYIHDLDYKNALKHHLAGSYLLYKQHGELSELLLQDEMSRLSYFRAALISRKNFINCKTLVEVMNALYRDPETGKQKAGTTHRIEDRNDKLIPDAGTHRRLVHFEKRLERNFDFYSMSSEQILGILPAEFNEFKS